MRKEARTTKQAKLDKEKILYFLNKQNDMQHKKAKANFDRRPYGLGGTNACKEKA